MRSRPGSGYCFLGPRSPTARLVMPSSFLSIAENCGVIRSGAQERRCYGPRLHPAILYCSNLDSASPSRPPIESQTIYYSLESEQQQDHVDFGKRVNKRTIGVGGISSRREGKSCRIPSSKWRRYFGESSIKMHNMRYACNPSPRILYPLHNVRVVLVFSWDFPVLQRARRRESGRSLSRRYRSANCQLESSRVTQQQCINIYTKSTPLYPQSYGRLGSLGVGS